MYIGVLRVVVAIPGNDSLKGKRSVVKKLVERSKSRFNVTAAEVGDQDLLRRATLGFAVVSGDGRHAESSIATLKRFLREEADLLSEASEVLSAGDELGRDMRSMADAERAKRNDDE